jgi:hypothetical protein
MERKGVGMMGTNRFDKFSFWQGKVIYNFMDVPIGTVGGTRDVDEEVIS